MTNDYANTLTQYISNTLTPGNPDNTPVIKESNILDKQISSSIKEELGDNVRLLDFEILTSETTDNIVLYGSYDYEVSGVYITEYYIAVLDPDYNVVFISNEYSSGTPLSPIIKLDYDDEGRIWGIDEYGTTTETGDGTTPRYRLIMLNNVAVPNQEGTFEIKLRKTYQFPIGYNKIEGNFLIKKVPDKALYYILSCDYGTGLSSGRYVSVLINVGSSNEWNTATSLYGIGDNDDLLIAPYNDDYIMYYTSTQVGHTNLISWVEGSSATVIDTLNIEGKGIKIISSSKFSFIHIDAINDIWEFCLYDNGEIITLDQYGLYTYLLAKTYYINGLTFYNIIYKPTNTSTNAKCGCYDGENYTSNEFYFGSSYIGSTNVFLKNNYGLYSLSSLLLGEQDDSVWETKIIYYTGLYNGTKYTNYNSLIGQSAEIYNNNNIIFARSLYNSTIYENQTNSTIVIPNTFLNNTQLTKQILYGETNAPLIDNQNTITKNVYETLYLNFINTINVIDEDTNTNYPLTASYINQNINTGTKTNYENTYIGKIKVNKVNNPFITNVIWSGSPNTSTRETNFSIIFDDDITSIDFLSNDETTTYYTLDTSSWETGKTYLITQYLRIE